MKQVINRLLIVLFFVLGVALIPASTVKASTAVWMHGNILVGTVTFSSSSSQYDYNQSATFFMSFDNDHWYGKDIGVEVRKSAGSSFVVSPIKTVTGTDSLYWTSSQNAPTTIGFYNATVYFTWYQLQQTDYWDLMANPSLPRDTLTALSSAVLNTPYKVVNQPPTISTPSASPLNQTSEAVTTTFSYNNNLPGLATYNAALGTWNNIADVTQTGVCYTTTGSSSYSIAIVGTNTATINGGTCIKNGTIQSYPYPSSTHSTTISGLTPGTTYYTYGYVQYSTTYLPAVEGGQTYVATAIAKSYQGTFTTMGGAITVTVTADSQSVNYSGGTTIRWQSTGATSCAVTSPASYVGKSGTTGLFGSFTASPLISPTEFIVTCSN